MRRLLKLVSRRDPFVLASLLLVGSVAYFGLTDYQGHRGGVAQLDGYYYYIYLRSLQVDGDLDFENEYAEWGNPFKFGKTRTGKARNIFGIGPAIMWSPFFVATHLTIRSANALGGNHSLDGLSRAHQVGTFFGSLLYGWLAVVLCFLIARRVGGRRHAIWAALGAALAGPLPHYCLTGAAYSHAAAAMATSLLTLLWISWRDSLDRRRWIWLGAVTGLVMLVRPACAPFVLLPVIEAFRGLAPALRQRRWSAALRALGQPALGAAVALLVFSPQLVIWTLVFGSPLTVPQGHGFFWWSANAWHSTLFSPRNGLLTTMPLVVAILGGLLLAARQRAHPARALLVVLAGYALLNGAVHDWWGWNFSSRRFTSCLPIFAVGLVEALRWAREWIERRPARAAAWITATVVALAVLFNITWMRSYNQRNLKWYSLRSTEGLYMMVTRGMVDRLYDEVGNPLSLPASIPFALRHGTKLRTYDRIDGSYLLGEINPDTNPGGDPDLHALIDLSSGRFRYNLSDNFGAAVRDAPIRYVPLRSERGRILLPLNRPGALDVIIRGRAIVPGTTVTLGFNGKQLDSRPLPTRWTALHVRVPADEVLRGVNRLELSHRVPALPTPVRAIGRTGQTSPVDIAVASGGLQGGRFCEIWVGGRLVSANHKGLNIALVDPRDGTLLDTRGLSVHIHKRALYAELGRYLSFYPKGTIVALGTRGDAGKSFVPPAPRIWRRFGATTDLSRSPEAGYAAIGVLGAATGTAIESTATSDHARALVGRKPPPWREVARYSAIRLR